MIDFGLRDLKGYGQVPPRFQWPDQAQIAVQFVVNYEEGGENSILYGDRASEAFLSEIVGAQPIVGARHLNMESIYEFGSRRGIWRLLEVFSDRELPATVFAVGSALEQHPEIVEPVLKANWEIASHGWRWIDYQNVPLDVEAEHIAKSVALHHKLIGKDPFGWYTGRTGPNTRELVMDLVRPLYDADSYADELPYYLKGKGGLPYLIVPYTLDANDMRFATSQGFNSGDQFFTYLKDSFDCLYEEGEKRPAMMSVGLHCRLVGRPGRAQALKRFLDYIQTKDRVWVARRDEIAKFWLQNVPAKS